MSYTDTLNMKLQSVASFTASSFEDKLTQVANLSNLRQEKQMILIPKISNFSFRFHTITETKYDASSVAVGNT